jgi:hypothetical protein
MFRHIPAVQLLENDLPVSTEVILALNPSSLSTFVTSYWLIATI